MLCIYGGKKKTTWVIDPPEPLAFFYNHTIVEWLLGKRVVPEVSIFYGWISIGLPFSS